MPIFLDDQSAESAHSGAVAWLRFIEEEDGRGIRSALFQTSADGQPLEFLFTRVDQVSLARPGPAAASALSSLARSLFEAAASSPSLIFALADEAPVEAFTGNFRLLLPFCRIGIPRAPVDARNDGPGFELLWATERPCEESGARRILGEIMEGPNPLEPFERAGEALAIAFGDERVRAVTAISGLAVLVSLRPSSERRSGSTLPERLWTALAAPLEGVHLKWFGELMPFQREGVRALLDNNRLLLADDMGLGKTIQAIAALRILRARREIRSCLVAAPASLLDQWRREIARWAPELGAIIIRGSTSDRSWQWAADREVILVSYDTLRSDFGGNAQAPVRRKTWDVVVADEAQRIKNRNDTSDALKGLKRTRSWALTGTPIENHEEELASILEFVDHRGSGEPERYRPGVELRERHRELQLRRKKGEVLEDLPPKQVTKVTIELSPRQRDSYDKAEQEGIVYLKSLGAEVGVQHVLELITRLKQIW